MDTHMDCVRISRRRALSALAGLPALRALRGQSQAPTFSTSVKIVNLFATVRTRQGEIVSDLGKDDFTLRDDGKPQVIKYFSRESDLPLTLGLLIDTSDSQRSLIGEESAASYRFIEQVIREDKDLAFVIRFDRQVELLQDVTSSRKLLEKALGLLSQPAGQLRRAPQEFQGPGRGGPGQGPGRGGSGPGRGGAGGGGTALFDAVWLASNEIMKKQSGRKAVVILSDGVDRGSRIRMDEAIEAAQRVDTLAYSVLFSDPDAYGGPLGGALTTAMGSTDLERLSRQTGGRYFEVSKKRTLADVYRSIEEELRSLYSIGYTPEHTGRPVTYHKIKLTAKRNGLVVQTRDGYYEE
jgi:VWFA-related protein